MEKERKKGGEDEDEDDTRFCLRKWPRAAQLCLLYISTLQLG